MRHDDSSFCCTIAPSAGVMSRTVEPGTDCKQVIQKYDRLGESA